MFGAANPSSSEVPPHEPRIRWLFATLLVFSAFAIGIAGFGMAGFGPCAFSNPAVLFFSAGLSGMAIYSSVRVLTQRQRRLRLRTLPFYLTLLGAVLFTALQVLILVSS